MVSGTNNGVPFEWPGVTWCEPHYVAGQHAWCVMIEGSASWWRLDQVRVDDTAQLKMEYAQ